MSQAPEVQVPGGLGQRAVFVCDHEAKNLYTNSAYQSMTGTTPEELLGLGWISFVHPEDLPVSGVITFQFLPLLPRMTLPPVFSNSQSQGMHGHAPWSVVANSVERVMARGVGFMVVGW
jgi:PAS domain-containing protein